MTWGDVGDDKLILHLGDYVGGDIRSSYTFGDDVGDYIGDNKVILHLKNNIGDDTGATYGHPTPQG